MTDDDGAKETKAKPFRPTSKWAIAEPEPAWAEGKYVRGLLLMEGGGGGGGGV